MPRRHRRLWPRNSQPNKRRRKRKLRVTQALPERECYGPILGAEATASALIFDLCNSVSMPPKSSALRLHCCRRQIPSVSVCKDSRQESARLPCFITMKQHPTQEFLFVSKSAHRINLRSSEAWKRTGEERGRGDYGGCSEKDFWIIRGHFKQHTAHKPN
jgi:hypothetical protein